MITAALSLFAFSLGDFDFDRLESAKMPRAFRHHASLSELYKKPACKDSIYKLDFENGYKFVFTNEDDCDGGNSHGLIYLNGKVVGLIEDSFFVPLKEEKEKIDEDDVIDFFVNDLSSQEQLDLIENLMEKSENGVDEYKKIFDNIGGDIKCHEWNM